MNTPDYKALYSNYFQILNETSDLLAQLEMDCATNGSTKPSKYMEKTVASVINLTLFGFRFDQVFNLSRIIPTWNIIWGARVRVLPSESIAEGSITSVG